MKKNQKINVLVTGPSTDAGKGGQVTHIENIKSTFSGDENLQVEHFKTSSAREHDESPFKKLLLLIIRSVRFPFYLRRVNVVHINSTLDNKALTRDMVFMTWSLLLGKRFIVQYHGGKFQNTFYSKIKVLTKLWIALLKRSDSALVLTDEQYKLLSANGVARINKVVNYVGGGTFNKAKPAIFTFVFLGRIIRAKGIFEILDACKSVTRSHKFQVLFYGDGPDRELLLKKVKEAGLEDTVFWRGTVDGQEKVDAYGNAHAFLLPSYAEGLPYSVLEAMSYGLPVISTDIGSLAQVVRHKETGLIVPVNDSETLSTCMTTLMEDETTYQSMCKAAKSLINAHYSVETMKRVFTQLWSTKAR